jgi:hypothetical protein
MSQVCKFTIVLFFFLNGAAAKAHGLYARAELRGSQLRIEAWFDDDTPAEQAKVKIVSGGVVVREGTSDEKGLWLTEALPAGKYQIQVDAGAGHRRDTEFIMPEKGDISAAGPTKSEVKEQHWVGVIVGLLAITLLIMFGKYLLRERRA